VVIARDSSCGHSWDLLGELVLPTAEAQVQSSKKSVNIFILFSHILYLLGILCAHTAAVV